MEDQRTSKKTPDQTICVLKLGHKYPRKQQEHTWQNGQKVLKLHATRANTGIYEVLTDDKEHLKVIAEARLKTGKDTAPAKPCIEKEDSLGKPQAGANTDGPHRRKRLCGKLSLWPWYLSQFFFFKKRSRYQTPKAPWLKLEKLKEHSSVGCEESEINVRSPPSGEERW